MINFSNFRNIKNKEIKNKRVLFISLLLFSLIYISIISIIQIKKLKLLLNLKENYSNLDKYVNNQKYIFNKKIRLEKKLKNIKNKYNLLFVKIFNIKKVLKIISKYIPKDCSLDEFFYFKNKIILKGKSKSFASINNFAISINNFIGKIIKQKQYSDKESIIYILEILI